MPSSTISATRMRGLSDAYGSWKMICAWRRRARSSARLSAAQILAVEHDLAGGGLDQLQDALPTVVLPQPDSPTSASVLPAAIVKRHAVHRLDVRHDALEHALADREMHLEVAARAAAAHVRGMTAAAMTDAVTRSGWARLRPACLRPHPASLAVRLRRTDGTARPARRPDRAMPAPCCGKAPRPDRSARRSGSRRTRASAAAPAADHRQRRAALVLRRAAPRTACCEYGCCGPREERSRSAVSTISPAYITATRCAISATTPRSWVMSRIAMPRRRCSSRSSSSTCAWMVTSSAVVGSSAISSSGSHGERHRDHHALLHAAGELERIFVAGAARHRECRPRRAAPARAARSAAPRRRGMALAAPRRSARPTVSTGLRLVAGSWKIIAMRRPRTSRIALSGSASRSSPSSRPRRATIRPGLGQQAHHRQRGHRLAAARFARAARRFRRAPISKRQPSTARTTASRAVEPGRQVLDLAAAARHGRSSTRVSRHGFRTLAAARADRAPADRTRRAPHRRTGWPPAPART